MSRKTLLLILLLCTCARAPLHAQDGLFPTFDARARLLGGTGLAAGGLDGLWTNPAGLARSERKNVQAGASIEQRFGVSELTVATAGATYGLKDSGFGLQLASFGFADYRENRLGLAYGRQLTKKLRIGADLAGFSTATTGYAGTFNLTFGLGLQLEVIPELHVGARLFSPVRVERAPEDFLPQLLALGVSYRPSDRLVLNVEAHQDTDFPVRFRMGAEYRPAEELSIQLGVATEASEVSLGLGYRLFGNFDVRAGAAYHETLGLTPVVGVQWR